MSGRKYLSAIVIVALMVLSSVLLFTSRNATAATALWTSDMDFSGGSFFNGTGWQTQLHGTGAAAYIQNMRDATNWLKQYPLTDTGPRAGFAFANDSAEGRFILFGGLDGISLVHNDTWEYDVGATNWVRICNDDTPACAPPKRYMASMAYSNASKVAVMYGGFAADLATNLEDTWEYDVTTNTWTNHTGGSQPRALGAHRMVYDPVGNQIVLVGVTFDFSAMQTWVYSIPTHTWTQKTFTGTFSPRSGFSLGYNYETGYRRVVLFGGSFQTTLYQDTFEYNPQTNSWATTTPGTSPSARYDAGMVYSYKSGIQGLILWGGGSQSPSTETWRYYHLSGTATWEQLTVATSPSPARKQLGMAYDPGYDKMILYGGWTFPSGARLNDTWAIENGFKLEGKYSSLYFNTYDAGTTWQNLWWNQTPATVPANTLIRLMLNISNLCDEGVSPTWYGPNKVVNTYFTVPGVALGPLFSGYKCIKFYVDMITYDPAVAPKLEDVALDYAFIPKPPTLESKFPTGPGWPTSVNIYANFSKAMDPSTVSVSINPNVTVDTPWTWYQGNTKLLLKHSGGPLEEGKAYTVCIWGADTAGVWLDSSVFSNHCWIFSTFAVAPEISSHTPNQGDVGVGLSTPIVITFDKAMNTSTCWPYMTIDPSMTFSHTWNSPTNTILTMTPTTQYQQFTLYTVEMPVGDALHPCKGANNQLLTVGGPANPWSFQTLANDPYLVDVNPTNLYPFMTTNGKLWINFSRFMDTSAGGMSFYIHDLSVGATNVSATTQWRTNRSLVLTPTTSLVACHAFETRIWARDFVGRTLIPNVNVPNPWRFFTGGSSGANGCAPYMIFTRPGEGERDISPFENITIGWQFWPDGMSGGGMNPSSYTYKVTDPFGIDTTSRFTTWWYGMGNAVLQLNHTGYQMLCGQYTVRSLTARDNQGRAFVTGTADNPFHFTVNATVCPPVILWTSPADGNLNAPLTNPIIIKYSKAMDTGSVEGAFNLRPAKTPYGFIWSEGNTNVSISHAPLVSCESYNATSVGRDTDGNYLVPGPVPNPWDFRGDCVFGPKINQTYPANNQQGIPLTAPIWVNFTEPVQTNSLNFNLNPGAGTLGYTWSGDRKSVKITHATAYLQCTQYTANVVDVLNDTGFHLVAGPVPNPWFFNSYCPPPQIVSTIPPDGAINVGLSDPITIVFSKTMDKTSFVISVINTQPPAPPITFNSPSWPNAQTATVTHTVNFAVCTKYTVRVTARDTFGTNLGPGPVPNPWNFTTDCRFPLQNLQVHRAGSDVQLTWNVPSSGAAYYWVYHASDRLAAWPWSVLANITTNSYTHGGAISDMQNHFYIVRAFKSDGSSSSNSTMGALWHMQVTPNPTSNTFWFSLPYNSMYKHASDIASELGPSKTKVVAKWDPAKQQPITYYYLNGKWRGNNFLINAGDGMMIGIESQFDWAINGTDKVVGLIFSFHASARTNYYWISLPLTNKYLTASQVVISIAGGLGPNTNTKIDEIGKWDFARQTSFVFKYGTLGWGGDNFVINPGDTIWLRITSSFSWSPELVTPEVL